MDPFGAEDQGIVIAGHYYLDGGENGGGLQKTDESEPTQILPHDAKKNGWVEIVT